MRRFLSPRLLAVLLSAFLLVGFAPMAHADVAGLTPCSESARFQQRAATAKTDQAKARFAMYRGDKDATMKEIQIDLPLAFKSTLAAATWPLAAFGELTSGKLLESDDKVTVSPR
jgi:photosystem I subunit 3